jgi:hypothetical protein
VDQANGRGLPVCGSRGMAAAVLRAVTDKPLCSDMLPVHSPSPHASICCVRRKAHVCVLHAAGHLAAPGGSNCSVNTSCALHGVSVWCSWSQVLLKEGVIEKYIPVDFGELDTVFDTTLQVRRHRRNKYRSRSRFRCRCRCR